MGGPGESNMRPISPSTGALVALREWIGVAEAVRATCLNLPEFDALIRHQKQRLEGPTSLRLEGPTSLGSNQPPRNEMETSEQTATEKIKVRSQGKKYIYIHNDLANAALHFKSIIEGRLEK